MPTSPIAATLQPFVDRHQLAGAVTLIADADQIIDLSTVGYADIAAGKPMTEDSMFWIASTTKPMTGTLFMTLVDEGKVSPSDPVERYLPEFKDMMYVATHSDDNTVKVLKKATRPIKLHDLLCHMSGLPFLSKSEPVIDVRPLREVVVSAASGTLLADVGSQYIYSNAGSNTVGRVVEAILGQPYETALQQRVLDPLGMRETTFFPTRAQRDRLAKSYKSNEAKNGLEVTTLHQFLDPEPAPRYAAPGGGLFGTAADVTAFARMILRGGELNGQRIVSRDAVRTMTSTHTRRKNDDPPEYGYGYQFGTTKFATAGGPSPAGWCEHGGAYSNQMWIDPESGLTIVVMVQHAGWPDIEGETPLQAAKRVAIETFGRKR